MPERDPRPGAPEALAFAGHYRLLAELFAREPDAELLELAAEVPALRPHATRAAAAEHTHVFVLNVYPFASVFLDREGALDGPHAAFTSDVLGALGLSPATGQAADHVAVLFDALAELLEREAGAEAASLDAQRARHGQRALLFEHLLPWVPLFLSAIERVDSGLYGAASVHARTLLIRHARALLSDDPDALPASAAEPPQARVEDATGRGDDGALTWLTTPASCGLYLSRADLAAIAADLDLALRFGGRAFMLDSLVQAAAQHDATEALTEALAALIAEQQAELATWGSALPALEGLWLPWLERSSATLAYLDDGPDDADRSPLAAERPEPADDDAAHAARASGPLTTTSRRA